MRSKINDVQNAFIKEKMSGINMQLPPPNVTGIAIPGNLAVKSGQLSSYEELLSTRRQARDAVELECKKYQKKDKHKTPGVVKFFGGLSVLTGLAFLAKKLLRK